MQRICKTGRGFTLIELLIVVAIIAILAAIAVPNFLEAQTRSKVSRAQADMRSMATALEAYYVDNNRYPFGRTVWIAEYGGLAATLGLTGWEDEPSFMCLTRITTPIGYMTTLPADPFAEGGGAKHHDLHRTTYGDPYYTFYYDDYQAYGNPELLDGTLSGSAWQDRDHGFFSRNFHRIHDYGYRWSLHSVGPLRLHGGLLFALVGEGNLSDDGSGDSGPSWSDTRFLYPYDPTNGTLSRGAVARTNKGVFTEVNRGKVPPHAN